MNAIIPRAKEREKSAEETEATFENQATQAATEPKEQQQTETEQLYQGIQRYISQTSLARRAGFPHG